MTWFDKPFNIKFDPDDRQDKSSGECKSRPMTVDEWEKYGPKSEKKKPGFVISQNDVQRVLEHRGIRKNEAQKQNQ